MDGCGVRIWVGVVVGVAQCVAFGWVWLGVYGVFR